MEIQIKDLQRQDAVKHIPQRLESCQKSVTTHSRLLSSDYSSSKLIPPSHCTSRASLRSAPTEDRYWNKKYQKIWKYITKIIKT